MAPASAAAAGLPSGRRSPLPLTPPPATLQLRDADDHGSAGAATEQHTLELENMLIEKVALCHAKDEELARAHRRVKITQADLDERAEYCDVLKRELLAMQQALQAERSERANAERALTAARAVHAPDAEEITAIKDELACFRRAFASSAEEVVGGGAAVPARSATGAGRDDAASGDGVPALRDEVGMVSRALLALQLDLIRALSWSRRNLAEQCAFVAHTIAQDEASSRVQLFVELERDARRLCVAAPQQILRASIDRQRRGAEKRLLASERMLAQYSSLLLRTHADTTVQQCHEWVASSALLVELARKSAALKLRTANTLIKRAREESQAKSQQLEQSKRAAALTRARYDATRLERTALAAAVVAASTRSPAKASAESRRAEEDAAAAAAALLNNSGCSASGRLLHPHEMRTASSIAKTRAPLPLRPATTTATAPSVSPTRRGDTPPPRHRGSVSHDGADATTSGTAALRRRASLDSTCDEIFAASGLISAEAAVAWANSPTRQTRGGRRRTSVAESTASSSLSIAAELASSESARAAAAAAAAAAQASSAELASRVTQMAHEIQALQVYVAHLETASREKDKTLTRVRDERGLLAAECDIIAAQCRLLEQACRFGARQSALRLAGADMMTMMVE